MVGISIRVEGSEKASAELMAAADRLDNPMPLYDDIGLMLVASTQQRFEMETDPQGNPWPQSIRVQLEGGKTLTDTGRLAGSITNETDAAGLEVGTNEIHAAIHQQGGTIRAKTKRGLRFRPLGANSDIIRQSVTIPRRAFLGLDDQDEADITRLVAEYVGGAFEGGLDAR